MGPIILLYGGLMSYLVQRLRMAYDEPTLSAVGESLFLMLYYNEFKAALDYVNDLRKGFSLIDYKEVTLKPRLNYDRTFRGVVVNHKDLFEGDKRNDPKISEWRYDQPVLKIGLFFHSYRYTERDSNWDINLVINAEGTWVYFSKDGFKTDAVSMELLLSI